MISVAAGAGAHWAIGFASFFAHRPALTIGTAAEKTQIPGRVGWSFRNSCAIVAPIVPSCTRTYR